MSLTNIRQVSVMRATWRGREVEFQWEQRGGYVQPMRIVDAATRRPLPWTLTDDEQAQLDEILTRLPG